MLGSQHDFPSKGEDTSSVVSVVFMRVLSLFPSSGCRCGQSQPPNPFQNGPEHLSRDRHFRHLKHHLPRMAHDLRPNLDQFLPQRRQRSVTHRSGQHGLPQEVAQVVGQHEQLQPHQIVHKVVTGHGTPDCAGHGLFGPANKSANKLTNPRTVSSEPPLVKTGVDGSVPVKGRDSTALCSSGIGLKLEQPTEKNRHPATTIHLTINRFMRLMPNEAKCQPHVGENEAAGKHNQGG